MNIEELLKEKNITKYKLSKESGIPYSTLNDLINGNVNPFDCSIKTMYNLSKILNISIDDLISKYFEARIDFELFKSNVCHKLKELGDINFIVCELEENNIIKYYKKKWYPECLYLLAMLDYISRINNIDYCKEYDSIRKMKLKDTIYPKGIEIQAIYDPNIKKKAFKNSIKEFKQFNIVESDIRNVA